MLNSPKPNARTQAIGSGWNPVQRAGVQSSPLMSLPWSHQPIAKVISQMK